MNKESQQEGEYVENVLLLFPENLMSSNVSLVVESDFSDDGFGCWSGCEKVVGVNEWFDGGTIFCWHRCAEVSGVIGGIDGGAWLENKGRNSSFLICEWRRDKEFLQ